MKISEIRNKNVQMRKNAKLTTQFSARVTALYDKDIDNRNAVEQQNLHNRQFVYMTKMRLDAFEDI
jgi:hypothetical protein